MKMGISFYVIEPTMEQEHYGWMVVVGGLSQQEAKSNAVYSTNDIIWYQPLR